MATSTDVAQESAQISGVATGLALSTFLAESAVIAGAITAFTLGTTVQEAATIHGVAVGEGAYTLVAESAQMHGAATQTGLLTTVVRESAQIHDKVVFFPIDSASDSASVRGVSVGLAVVTTATESAAIQGIGFDQAAPVNVAREVASISGQAVSVGFLDTAHETAQIHGGVTESARCTNVAVETATIGDTAAQTLIAVSVATDAATFADRITDNVHAIDVAHEEATISGHVVVPSLGLAWTAATDTFAMSRYTGFAFNSVAKVGNRIIAASDGGLYELGGATDNGRPIAAELVTGMSDFGSPQQKRLDSAYLGYSASGVLAMDVSVPVGGTETRYAYTFPARTAADPVANRQKFGRGLRSRYWRFIFRNVAGADFSVADMQISLENLSRKV